MPFENAFHVLIVPLVHFLYVHTFENAFYVFGLDTCRNVPPQLNLEVVHEVGGLHHEVGRRRRAGGAVVVPGATSAANKARNFKLKTSRQGAVAPVAVRPPRWQERGRGGARR